MGRAYTWRCAIIAGFGSMLYGIDNVVIAGTFAQPGFLEKFEPSATLMGAIATSFYGGTLLGIIGVFTLTDRFSRKMTLQFGAALGFVGAILQAASQHIALFTAARVITGVASGVMLTTVQIYQSEIAPPHSRGRMITLQICTINVAGLMVSFTGYGTYHASNPDLQWRLPIALQCLPALALFVGCFFIPYTPRWLVMQDRHEEAKVVLRRLHDDNKDHTFWEKEYTVLVAQLQFERDETVGVSFWHMFTNKKELKRAALAVAALTSCQTTGAQTIQVFQSVIYASLGFDTAKTLLYACIFQILLILGGGINLVAIDWIGRRFLFITGLILLSVILAVFTACQAQFEQTGDASWGKAGIAMVMIFIFFYGCTYVSTGYAYAAEILPTKIRAQGMALGMFSAYSMIIIFGQVTPIALDQVGYKYLPLFIGCNLFFLPIICIWFKETKGLSLEEINAIFGETVVRTMNEITAEEAHKKVLVGHVEQKD